jgi:hypothetical protein
MTEAIRHERQVELGFEMHRYFDLVRWGIAAQKIPEFKVGKHDRCCVENQEKSEKSVKKHSFAIRSKVAFMTTIYAA